MRQRGYSGSDFDWDLPEDTPSVVAPLIDEREVCAQICDEIRNSPDFWGHEHTEAALYLAAQRIRGRENKITLCERGCGEPKHPHRKKWRGIGVSIDLSMDY